MYPPSFAEALRRQGHDVVSVHDRIDLRGKSDGVVFAAAQAEGRAVLTNNARDYMPLVAHLARSGQRHFSLVLTSDRSVPRRRDDTGGFVKALEPLLSANPEDDALLDRIVWLTRPT